jgi:hypothetical protein
MVSHHSSVSAFARRRFWTIPTALIAILALLVSCTGSPPPPFDFSGPAPATTPEDESADTGGRPTATPTDVPAADPADHLPELEPVTEPAWVPQTRSEELILKLAAIGPNRQVPTQLAIDVFSVGVAPLPGATVSALPDGDGLGETALPLIMAAYDKLSPAQREVVDGIVTTDADIEAHARITADGQIQIPLTPGPGRALRMAPTLGQKYLRYATLLAQTVVDWDAYRPGIVASTIRLLVSTKPYEDAAMTALPNPDEPTVCDITVYPALIQRKPSDQVVKSYFAHELFHCAQFNWTGNEFRPMPLWLQEGSADFAAYDLYRSRSGPPAGRAALGWFLAAAKSLAARAYDAWPLYESVRQFGIDPYPAIRTMMQASNPGDTSAILTAGGLERLDFQAFVSSQSLRSTVLAEPTWLMSWPGPNAGAGPRDTGRSAGSRGIGTFPVLGHGSHSHLQRLVPMTRDVGLVLATGVHGPVQTIADIGTVTVAEGQQKLFCVDAGKCQCPEGTASSVEAIPLTPPMVFSFPQRDAITNAAVRNMKWDPDKYCKAPQPRKRAASSNGDPHQLTFDGYAYDMMALGEFVTVRDPRGGLEVQSRHELIGTASATSAVAVGTGQHRITMTTVLQPEGPVTVRLDGQIRTETAFDAGDVAVRTEGQVVTVTWPDGSEVRADSVYGFFLTVTLTDERAARAVGSLGSADHNMFNDLRMADGSPVLDPDLDGAFADSWAVQDRTSLFDYEPGQSTATFRKPLPKPANGEDLSLDPDAVATCTERLGEDAASYEVRSCAYDVTVTGYQGFVGAYQQVTADRVALNAGVLFPGSSAPPIGDGPDPAAATLGKPVLELHGTLAFLSDEPDEVGELTGSVRLASGTVLVVRVDVCRPDFDLDLHVRARTEDGQSATAHVCDPRGFGTYDARDGDVVPGNEAYLWIPAEGDYDVTVSTGSADAASVKVQLFADPTPTELFADDFKRSGYTGTLGGIGDTVLVGVNSPGERSEWSVSADDGVCAAMVHGPDWDSTSPWALGGVCHRQPTLGLSPYERPVPVLIFSRAAGTQKVAIARN